MSFEKWISKYGTVKVFVVFLSVMLVTGIVTSLLVNAALTRFEVDGIGYRFETVENHVWTFKDSNEKLLKVYPDGRQYGLDASTSFLIMYDQRNIKQVVDFQEGSSSIFSDDTQIYKGEIVEILVSFDDIETGTPVKKAIPFEKRLINELLKVAEHVQSGAFIGMIFLDVLLISIGSAYLFFPLFFWQMKHIFDVKGGEPTDFYYGMTRISGGLLVLGGLLFPLFQLF